MKTNNYTKSSHIGYKYGRLPIMEDNIEVYNFILDIVTGFSVAILTLANKNE